MATPTTPTTGLDDNQLNAYDYATGTADAYDENRAGLTLAELTVRLAWLIDEHTNLSYVLGYASVVQRLAVEADITAEVDAELAYTHVETNPEAVR